ncbi:hypothetical protein PHSY_000523 [Pseudozyma hubeiensis SY62]|uniref:DNA-directed RNA polymerases I, II, and III subunit RPABC5 n=1 Tax=Pseudozyma hubeiensis (strain SY62) TaxID=1305764 RepID=R9NWH6_PSEHS|nr:hypothetical protein PHSY_000523 [Pseudozyma hubeiensis SY62]GAC92963.1 hypothetical protein PHSY_000523 [Pseudozyma hubeiensis SY62]
MRESVQMMGCEGMMRARGIAEIGVDQRGEAVTSSSCLVVDRPAQVTRQFKTVSKTSSSFGCQRRSRLGRCRRTSLLQQIRVYTLHCHCYASQPQQLPPTFRLGRKAASRIQFIPRRRNYPFANTHTALAMIIPIRCFSCGKVIGDKWNAYLALLLDGRTEGEALTELDLKRYCCRRMVLTHVDLIEKLLHYNIHERRVQA